MVGQKYFKGRQTSVLGGQTYTKYNKINNNSENFSGARLLPEGGFRPPGPLSYGPVGGRPNGWTSRGICPAI